MASFAKPEKREQMRERGYCVLPDVLDSQLLAKIRTRSTELAEAMTDKEKQTHRYTGSLIPTTDAVFAPLITSPALLECFDAVGFAQDDLRFMCGFVISKPPHAPSLAWHQDCVVWDHDCAYEEDPHQIFAMIYLQDTTIANGCLRAIPGTHRKRHPMHDVLLNTKAHSDAVRAVEDWASLPEHAVDVDGAVDIEVKAGDVVLGDNRVLHAARRNATASRRSLITLWFHPNYSGLPGRVKDIIASSHAKFSSGIQHAGWDAAAMARLQPLLPDLRGYEITPASSEGHDKDNHSLDNFDRVVRVERLLQA